MDLILIDSIGFWFSINCPPFEEGRFHWWWTSGSDENEEDQWTWTANGEPFTFINWNKWQPNGGTENNYMLMVSSYYRFEWYDVDAQEQSFSICERHLDSWAPKNTTTTKPTELETFLLLSSILTKKNALKRKLEANKREKLLRDWICIIYESLEETGKLKK